MAASINEALSQYQAEDYAAAKESCTALVEASPLDPLATYLLGLSLMRLGHIPSGEARITAALNLAPEIGHHDMLRAIRIQQGRTDEAYLAEVRLYLYLKSRTIDAYLISYPKCGRTWLRLLLGKYVLGFDVEADPLDVKGLTKSSTEFTTLEVSHDDYAHWKPYDKIEQDKRAYAGKKVLFMVRDPRDVVVSNYFQYVKRGRLKEAGYEFEGTISDFLRHDIGGLKSVVAFFNVWADSRNVPEAFEIVSYEDLTKDPAKTLARCIAFLDWPEKPDGYLQQVVDYGSFEKMRGYEETNAFKNFTLVPPKRLDPEGFKVRKGKIGGYRDYLSADDIEHMNAYIARNLNPLYGYREEED